MFDRSNVRAYWPLLSYFNKPISALKNRIEEITPEDLTEILNFDPIAEEGGVNITYKHARDLFNNIYVKLATIYCGWENNAEVLSDRDIRKLMIGLNFDIYEAYFHLLKLGVVFIPKLRANSKTVYGYKETLIDFVHRAHLSYPETFIRPNEPIGRPLTPGEDERLYTGEEIPEIALERDFVFHEGSTLTLETIRNAVDIRDFMDTEHPSIGRIMELLRILEITLNDVPVDEFAIRTETSIQEVLLTLLYTFGRWSTFTVATLLKDDQMLRIEYEQENKPVSFQNYRDAAIGSILNPLVLTSTSIN